MLLADEEGDGVAAAIPSYMDLDSTKRHIENGSQIEQGRIPSSSAAAVSSLRPPHEDSQGSSLMTYLHPLLVSVVIQIIIQLAGGMAGSVSDDDLHHCLLVGDHKDKRRTRAS